jgi:hypothetical protein
MALTATWLAQEHAGKVSCLGPGVAQLLTHAVTGELSRTEVDCLYRMRYDRTFDSKEMLK